ncbi:hypothetical protein SANA_03550 [Gottschalkiaceae bacterium SANA]|nr:hypothetical protein SANA_03550 [Gottschalkiaceae bacterium SANA]
MKHENEGFKDKVKFLEEQFKLSQSQKYGSPSDTADPMQLMRRRSYQFKKIEEPDLEEITYKRKKDRSKSRKTYKDLEA